MLVRLRMLIKKDGIDLIHTNGLKCHFLGAVLSILTKAKVVWHIREIYIAPIRIALRVFRLGRAEVIAISWAVRKGLGIKSARVIYNGVDTGLFYPFDPDKDIKKETGLKKEKKVITMLGALTSWKGQHIFLEAIAKLRDRFPDLAALIVGGELYTGVGHRGYLAYLKDKVKKLGIENQVSFLGVRGDIPHIINSSFALVHASLKPEPFGRVLIEAMACGKAVIAARGGAVEEIIRDGVDGIIIEKGNAAALAQAIASLIEGEAMARDMGERGRQRVEELFSGEKKAREVEEVYFS